VTEAELDALLRRLPETAADDDDAAADDALLLRHGELSETDAAALEGRLAQRPRDRSLFVELSEPVPPRAFARAEEVLPTPAAKRGWLKWLLAPGPLFLTAAMAGAMLWLTWPGDVRLELPPYAAEGPFGGLREVQGAEATTQRFGPGSTLRVVLRPARAGSDAPPVAVVVEGPGAPARRVEVEVLRGEGGALEVSAPARRVFDVPGRYTLHIAVGAEAIDPEDLARERARLEARQGRWLTVRAEYLGER